MKMRLSVKRIFKQYNNAKAIIETSCKYEPDTHTNSSEGILEGILEEIAELFETMIVAVMKTNPDEVVEISTAITEKDANSKL